MKLGVVLGKQGRFLDATQALSRSIELDPKNGDSYFNRGIVYEFLGDTFRASADFSKAKKLSSEKNSVS